MVRSHVLRLTPIGMHIDEVVEVVGSREGWRSYVNYNSGFMHPRLGASSRSSIIGRMSIRVRVDPYWPSTVIPPWGLLARIATSILWGFDSDGILIEVYVHKSMGW